MRNANKITIGEREGNSPLGTHKPGWEDNIKMYPKVRDLEAVDSASAHSRQW